MANLKDLGNKIQEMFGGVGKSLGIEGFQNGNVQIRNNSLFGNALMGTKRMTDSIQSGQALPTSMRAQAVPSAMGAVEGIRRITGMNQQTSNQIGQDLGFGLRGALGVTPFQANPLTPQLQQIQSRTNPTTFRQQAAQSIGQGLYGSALTAPIAGGTLGILKNTVMGTGLGVGMGVGADLLTGQGLPNKQRLAEHALSGFQSSWVLPITNSLTDKALARFAPNLIGGSIAQPFKIGQVREGFNRLFLRALAEVPAENTAFTWLGRLDTDTKQSFIQDWINNLPGNIATNLVFAGVQGTKETVANRQSRIAVNNALKETARKWNRPVATTEFDNNGRRVIRPMWQQAMMDRVGMQARPIRPEERATLGTTQPKGVGGIKTPNQRILPNQNLQGNVRAMGDQLSVPEKKIPQPQEATLLSNRTGSSNKIIASKKTGPSAQELAAIKDFEENVLGKKPVYPEVESKIASQAPKVNPGVNVDTSKQAVNVGETKAAIGMVDNAKKSFANWVNARRATTIEGHLKSQEFADLDSKGLQGFFEFQSGDKSGRYADVKKYFDAKYDLLKKEGIGMSYRQDYLPQLWADAPEKVQEVLGRTLTSKPSFTLEAVLKSYQEGMEKGLTPRFGKISDLVRWYESYSNKAVADHQFFRSLVDENMIFPASKAPRDWVTLNPDRFPKIKGRTETGTYTGDYKAPKEVAEMINNYLGSSNETVQRIANWASTSKNRMLSFGIPGTAINAHGFNILARSIMSNPLKGVARGIKYMLHSGTAGTYLENNLSKAPQAIKYGLTLSSSEYKVALEQPTGLRSKFGQTWNNAFEKPLFDRMIPALKLEWFDDVFNGYKKSMPEDQAGKQAAKFVNDVFGGVNWEELGKNRNMQAVKQIAILAPDWLQTNLNLPKEMIKALINPKSPQGAAYRKMAAGLLASYTALNITNKALTGHWTWQNDPGNEFNLDTGTYTPDGQKRHIRVFGTAADFVRIPSDIISGLVKGDPSVAGRAIRNRFSTILQPAASIATNTDYLGNPIFGRTKYGQEMTLGQNLAGAWTVASPLIGAPSFLQSGLDVATGKKGVEQGLTAALELPTRYSGGTYSTAQKQGREITGVSGKELYEQNTQLKGQAKFGDTQLAAMRQGVTFQNIIDKRASDRVETEARNLVKESGADQMVGNKYFFLKDGEVKSVDLSPIEPPKKTGLTELDAKSVSKYNSDINSQINGIFALWEAGKIDQNKAETMLKQLKSMKISTKKPKKISIPKTTIKKFKVKTSPVKKVKLKKAPTFKLTTKKTPNLTVSVPKSVIRGVKVSKSRA